MSIIEKVLTAIVIVLLALNLCQYFFLLLKEKAYLIRILSRLDIADVSYSFEIKQIKKSRIGYTLIGVDGISVDISEEMFEVHVVEVGKRWIYDGNIHFCLDANYKLVNPNEGVLND